MTDPHNQHPRTIRIFGRRYEMPKSRAVRIAIGALLILFGIVGFLPVVGFWMIPLGVFVISHEFAMARRYRRRSAVWWGRRRKPRRRDAPPDDTGDAA